MSDPVDAATPMSDSKAADSTAPAAAAAAGAASVVFKKRGAKRKEFRAPAASLATRTDATPSTSAPEAPTAESLPSDSVEDTTQASEAEAPAKPVETSMKPATEADNDDSDDDAPTGGARLSSAALLAQAAEVDTSDPDNDEEEAGGQPGEGATVIRPSKRVKSNPLAQTTRQKLSKEHNLTIQSTRSALADTKNAEHQITQVVESAQVKRDPSKPKWSGPSKPMASNVRIISQMDYNPSICKDYKETGRCGYGDSCVFLHDRGTYKQSWQLDADWNAAQEAKRKRALLGLPDEDDKKDADKEEEGLPWACFICRNGFTTPIVTNCGHYFCEQCALAAYVKDTKCPACRAQTHGAFNTATKLISVLKQRAAAGVDPRAEIERLEKQREQEKAARATGHNWQMPGRTPDLQAKKD